MSAVASSAPISFGLEEWNLIQRRSGPVNYYSKLSEGDEGFIRAEYKPSFKTAVMGIEIPSVAKNEPRRLSWKWRALKLPEGGNECAGSKNDSAAVVYVIWKSGLKYYTLKYVWSAGAPAGTVCDSKRSFFVAQDTIVLRSGGPIGEWAMEEIDPTAAFRNHFRNGDPKGDVPELYGIGIMTDGDQTRTESSADYASFVLTP